MGYRLDLSHPDGRTGTIDAETTNSVNFTHNYSAESEFEASVPYDVDLLDWELAEVQIYYVFPDGTTLHKFRGEVERVKGNYEQGTMTVYGPGVEHELTKGVADKVIQNKTTEQAIKDYYANELPGFSSNVVAPNPQTVATDDNVQTADTTSEWDGIFTPAASTPVGTGSSYLQELKSAWSFEAENYDAGSAQSSASDIFASGGSYLVQLADFFDPEWNFSTDHTIPESYVGLHIRYGMQYINWTNPDFPEWQGAGFKANIDGTNHTQFANGFGRQYSPQDGKLWLPRNVFQDDGGTFTDETTAAQNDTADDMHLLPASPATGDAYYFGKDGPFDELKIDISTAGAGTYSLTWEYYAEEKDSSGSTIASGWRDIPNVTDGTNGFRNGGVNSVTWSLEDIAKDTPNGGAYNTMASTTVNGTNDVYVRARVTSFSSLSTQPLGKQYRHRGGPISRYTSGSWSGGDLAAGSHTLRIAATQDAPANMLFDVVGVYDSRYTYTFDNNLNAESGYLDGPEPYPDSVAVQLEQIDVPYNITESTVQTTEAGGQPLPEIAVSPDGGSTWKTAANVNDATFTISVATTTLDTRLTLGRYGSTTGQTPLQGTTPMRVDVYDHLLDGNDLGVIEELELTGNHLENLKAIHETSDYRFVMDHDPNALNIESFPADTEKTLPDLTIKNRLPSTDVGGYANKVHVFGAKASDGTRPVAVVQDDTEINEVGVEPVPIIAPDLTTVTDVKNKARTELTKRVAKRRNAGELEVVAQHPLPGYTYPVDLTGDGTTTKIPLETVDFSEGRGEADGRLSFEALLGVEIEVAAAKRTTRNISTLL